MATDWSRFSSRPPGQAPAVDWSKFSAAPPQTGGDIASEGVGPVEQAMISVGRGATDVGQALKQLANFSETLPFINPAAANPELQELLQRRNKDYNEQVADESALFDEGIGKRPGSGIGRFAGSALVTAPLGAVGRVPTTVAGAMGTGAATGALGAAVQPVLGGEDDESGSFLEQKATQVVVGGLTGAALGGLLQGGKVTYGLVRDAAKRLKDVFPAMGDQARQQAAAEILRRAAADPASLARAGQNSSAVPGVAQSLAEATDDSGIATLQRTLRSRSHDLNSRLTTQEAQNNIARVKEIQRAFGGADEASARAIEEARDKAAAPLLNKAMQVKDVDVSGVVRHAERLANRREGRTGVENAIREAQGKLIREANPSQQAREAVETLTGAQGRRMSSADFDLVGDAATQARRVSRGTMTADEAADALRRMKPTSQTAGNAIKDAQKALSTKVRNVDDLRRLYNARQHIGDMLNRRAGQQSDEARAAMHELLSIRGALDKRLRAASPEFGKFLDDFAGQSRQAGQVRAGAELLSKSGAHTDAAGNPVLSAAKFANAVNDLDQVAKTATGFRKATADRLLSDEQKSVAGAIRDDLSRHARSQTGGKAIGSNSAQNIFGTVRLAEEIADPGLLQMISPRTSSALNIMDGIRRRYNTKVLQALDEMIADPKQADKILRSLPQAQQAQARKALGSPMVMSALTAARRSAVPAASVGAEQIRREEGQQRRR